MEEFVVFDDHTVQGCIGVVAAPAWLESAPLVIVSHFGDDTRVERVIERCGRNVLLRNAHELDGYNGEDWLYMIHPRIPRYKIEDGSIIDA